MESIEVSLVNVSYPIVSSIGHLSVNNVYQNFLLTQYYIPTFPEDENENAAITLGGIE